MPKKEIKYLVGIFTALMALMAIYVPNSILYAVQQEFPEVSEVIIQMIVSIPCLFGIASNIIFSKFAYKLYKKQIVIICLLLFVFVGLIPFFLHNHIAFLLISACMVGFAMGGVQNSSTALICDYFDGEKRSMAMGLMSVFVGLGGTLFAFIASRLGAIHWHFAYLTYLCMIPLCIVVIIFMPKGILEAKPSKTNRVKVPSQVIWICICGFFTFTAAQLIHNNVSVMVAERGIGSTSEAGIVSSIYTLAFLFYIRFFMTETFSNLPIQSSSAAFSLKIYDIGGNNMSILVSDWYKNSVSNEVCLIAAMNYRLRKI